MDPDNTNPGRDKLGDHDGQDGERARADRGRRLLSGKV